MTEQQINAILRVVSDSVLSCPQLTTDPRLTVGQRQQAAKQICGAVAQKLRKPEEALGR